MPKQKIARSSMEYVNAIRAMEGGTRTAASRERRLNKIKATAADQVVAMNKIGQGFIGPVMMRLKYEGIVRNVLTEDIIAPGQVPVYDVADEMGKAFYLDNYQGEAVISQYEGKRLMYKFRHLAEFATVQEQDFYELTIDMADYAINEARQRIMEAEDTYLFAELDAAAASVTSTTPDWAGQKSHTISVTGGKWMPENFYDGATIATNNRLMSKNIVMNPGDAYDIYKWDLTATSVNFKDKTFDGVPVESFAGFNIFKSVMVKPGTAYMLPEADYLGRMPIRKQLEVRDNPKVENFSVGWVLDERFNLIILNTGGIVKLVKA